MQREIPRPILRPISRNIVCIAGHRGTSWERFERSGHRHSFRAPRWRALRERAFSRAGDTAATSARADRTARALEEWVASSGDVARGRGWCRLLPAMVRHRARRAVLLRDTE